MRDPKETETDISDEELAAASGGAEGLVGVDESVGAPIITPY